MKAMILVQLIFVFTFSYAQHNPIDSSFGNNGSVYTPLDTTGLVACIPAIQSDGKIVLTGYTTFGGVAVRYNPDGSLDNTFGINGKIEDSSFVLLSEVIQLANGQLLLGGAKKVNTKTKGLMKMLKPDGSTDTTFGNMGYVILPTVFFTGASDSLYNSRITRILENSSGLEVYGSVRYEDPGGFGGPPLPKRNVALGFRFHYDLNGYLDTTYNGIGYTGINTFGTAQVLKAGNIRYVLGGADFVLRTYFNNYIINAPESIMKLDSTGTQLFPVQTFLDKFVDLSQINSNTTYFSPTAMRYQSNKLLVSGFISHAAAWTAPAPTRSDEFGLKRYKLDGTLDSTFGTNGTVFTSVDSNTMATDVVVLPDNRILMVGATTAIGDSISRLTIVRFTPNGELDSSCYDPIISGIPVGKLPVWYVDRSTSIVKVEGNAILISTTRDSAGNSGFQLARYFFGPDTTGIYLDGNDLTTNRANAAYQWLDCNTMQHIPGETNQSFTPNHNGDYAVMVTENGCTDTSDCYAIYNIGIEQWNTSSIKVYPNPSHGTFTVECNETFEGELEVFSISGNRVYQQKINRESKLELNLSLAKGVYLIRMSSEKENYTKRIIIQ